MGRLPLSAIVLLGVVLLAPTAGLGFYADDYVHQLVLRGDDRHDPRARHDPRRTIGREPQQRRSPAQRTELLGHRLPGRVGRQRSQPTRSRPQITASLRRRRASGQLTHEFCDSRQ